MNREAPGLDKSVTEQGVKAAVQTNLGKPIESVIPQSFFVGKPCIAASAAKVVCTYFIEQSAFIEKGWRITYVAGGGAISSIEVSRAYRIREGGGIDL